MWPNPRETADLVILQKTLPLNSITSFLYSSLCNTSFIQKTLFESNLLSQGSIEQDRLPKNVRNLRSNKKINFKIESVKKPTIYDLIFIIAIFFSKRR